MFLLRVSAKEPGPEQNTSPMGPPYSPRKLPPLDGLSFPALSTSSGWRRGGANSVHPARHLLLNLLPPARGSAMSVASSRNSRTLPESSSSGGNQPVRFGSASIEKGSFSCGAERAAEAVPFSATACLRYRVACLSFYRIQYDMRSASACWGKTMSSLRVVSDLSPFSSRNRNVRWCQSDPTFRSVRPWSS